MRKDFSLMRKDFVPSEIEAIRRAMLPVEREAARQRQGSNRSSTFPKVSGK